MVAHFPEFVGFEWDKGNRDKNASKHNVNNWECEQAFFNEPLIVLADEKHSLVEQRYAAFGQTDDGRKLVIVFTRRKDRLRVISARDMNSKERKFYNEYQEEDNPKV